MTCSTTSGAVTRGIRCGRAFATLLHTPDHLGSTVRRRSGIPVNVRPVVPRKLTCRNIRLARSCRRNNLLKAHNQGDTTFAPPHSCFRAGSRSTSTATSAWNACRNAGLFTRHDERRGGAGLRRIIAVDPVAYPRFRPALNPSADPRHRLDTRLLRYLFARLTLPGLADGRGRSLSGRRLGQLRRLFERRRIIATHILRHCRRRQYQAKENRHPARRLVPHITRPARMFAASPMTSAFGRPQPQVDDLPGNARQLVRRAGNQLQLLDRTVRRNRETSVKASRPLHR